MGSKKIIVAAETVIENQAAQIPTAFEIYIAKQQAKAEADALVAKYAAEADEAARQAETLSLANLIVQAKQHLDHLETMYRCQQAEKAAVVETPAEPVIVKPSFEVIDKRNPILLGFDPKSGTLGGNPLPILGSNIPIIGAKPHLINVKAETINAPDADSWDQGFDAACEQFDAVAPKKAKIKPVTAVKAESVKPRDQKKAGIEAYKTLFQAKMHALIQKAKKTPGQWVEGSVVNPDAPELAMKFNVALAACANGGGEFELKRGGRKAYHIILSTDGNIAPSEIPVSVKQQ